MAVHGVPRATGGLGRINFTPARWVRPLLRAGTTASASPTSQGWLFVMFWQLVDDTVEICIIVTYHCHRVHERVHRPAAEDWFHALEAALRLKRAIVVLVVQGGFRPPDDDVNLADRAIRLLVEEISFHQRIIDLLELRSPVVRFGHHTFSRLNGRGSRSTCSCNTGCSARWIPSRDCGPFAALASCR